jgi:hypothetical protein
MKTLKNIKIENVIKVIVVSFILFTLTAVTIEAFSDLTVLNRAF